MKDSIDIFNPVFPWPSYYREMAHWVFIINDRQRTSFSLWPERATYDKTSDSFYSVEVLTLG